MHIINDDTKSNGEKFDTVKECIIKTFSESEESKLSKLLPGHPLGKLKPSQYLQKLRNMAGNNCNYTILKGIFIKQLPDLVQAISAGDKNNKLDDLAQLADRIIEAKATY